MEFGGDRVLFTGYVEAAPIVAFVKGGDCFRKIGVYPFPKHGIYEKKRLFK